jgi:hypothetical protein
MTLPESTDVVIERKFYGGTESVTFDDFALFVIQDDDEALTIAHRMLDGMDPYPFNEPHTGAEPEFYEEFRVLNSNKLREQISAYEEN